MSPIIEVIIGLIFIFSLLSVLVSQINSFIAQFFQLRARYLFEGVRDLIHDRKLTARFVMHPLIQMVERTGGELPDGVMTDDIANAILDASLSGVQWINPKTFSNVLLSAIRVDEDRLLFSVLRDIIEDVEPEATRQKLMVKVDTVVETGLGVNELINAVNEMPPSAHKKALIERLRDITKEIGNKGLKTDINVSLVAGVNFIQDHYLKASINTILATSKTLEEAEQKFENWFDQAMSKATEKYAGRMKFFSYVIGLLVAVLLNVDTLYIASKLWEDPLLRATVAETARNVDLNQMQSLVDEAEAASVSGTQPPQDSLAVSFVAIGETLGDIQQLRIPMGWDIRSLANAAGDPIETQYLDDSRYIWNFMPWNNPDDWFVFLVLKIFGLLATAIALGQGAPFWFGLIRQATSR